MTENPKRSGSRRWLKLVMVMVSAVLLGAALLPTLLSTGAGKSLVLSVAGGVVPGKITIDSISLSWLGGQTIQGFTLAEPDGKPVIQVAQISTQASLLGVATGSYDLGKTVVSGVVADFKVDEQGGSNLRRATQKPDAGQPSKDDAGASPVKLPTSLAGQIEVRDVRLTVTPATGPSAAVELQRLDAALPRAGDGPITFNLKGRIAQGNLGGDLEGQGKASGLIAPDGALTGDKATIDVKLAARGVPAEALDQLLNQGGLIAAALGGAVDANLAATATAQSQTLSLDASSSNLQLALKGQVAGETFSLTEPATLRFTATPALVDRLAAGSGLKLAAAVPVDLRIERLSSSIKGFAPGSIAVQLALSTGADAALSGDPALGNLTLGKLQASLQAASLTGDVTVKADAPITADQQRGGLNVAGSVSNLFNPAGQFQFDKLAANLVAKLQGLPVALLDRLAGQQGLLVEALGPAANLSVRAESTGADRITLALDIDADKVRSENLRLTLADRITLDQPAVIRARVTPALAARYLPKDPKITLLRDVPIVLTLQQLQAPRPKAGEKTFQPDKTLLHATLIPDPIALAGLPEVDSLGLENITLTLAGDSAAQPKITLAAQARQDDPQGLLTLLAGPGALSLSASAQTTLDADFKTGPIAATADLAAVQLNARAKVALAAGFGSLSVTDTALKAVATPALLKRLDLVKPGRPTPQGPTTLELAIRTLDLPLGGPLDLGRLKAALSGSVAPSSAAAEEPIIALFGSALTFDVQSMDGRNVSVKIDSRQLHADLAALISPEGRLSLTRPASMNLVLTPDLLRLFGAVPEGQPTIAGPTPIELAISRLDAPVKPLDLQATHAALTATIPKLALAGGKQFDGATLSQTRAEVGYNGPDASASVKLDGLASVPGQAAPGRIAVDAALARLFNDKKEPALAQADIEARSLLLQGLPTAFVEALTGLAGKLIPLVGPSLNVAGSANLKGGSGQVTLKADGANLAAELAAKVGPTLELTRPAAVKLRLTPEAYAAWTGGKSTALTEPADVSATIRSLRVPRTDQGLDLPASAFDVVIAVPSLSVRDDKSGRAGRIESFTADVKTAGLGKSVAIQAQGKALDTADRPGGIALAATVTELYNAQGALNTQALTADLDVKLVDIPRAILDVVNGGDDGLGKLLGEKTSLAAQAKLSRMQGPLRLVLDSTNVKADLAGAIAGDELTLTQNASLQMMFPRELMGVEVTMPAVLPGMGGRKLVTNFQSIEPARLVVDKTNFRLPIRNYDPTKVNIDRGTLSLGRILLRNDSEGLVRVLLDVAVQAGTVGGLGFDPSDQVIPIWAGPADFAMNQGVVTVGRADVLIGNDYQVALWGRADLPRDQGQFTLGITERALRRVYAIRAFSDNPDYVDQFKMQGPLSGLSPNKGELAARIAFLTSAGFASNLGGQKVGGFVDQIVKGAATAGAIIDAAKNKNKDKNMSPPAPSPKRPFPWDSDPQYADPGPNPANTTNPKQPNQPAPNSAQQPTQPAPNKPSTSDKAKKLLDSLFK